MPYDVFKAAQRIAVLVNRDVDLIDFGRVGDVMKVQVIGGGKRMFTSDELAAANYEMLALNNYARLNEQRREVLVKGGVA